MRLMNNRKLRFLAVAGAVACLMMVGVHPAGARGDVRRVTGNELTLSFDTQTWVNSLSGSAVITGSVDCPAVAQEVYISLNVTQPDEPYNHSGYGYAELQCDEPSIRWMTTVDGDDFEAGAASVEGTASYEIEPADAERSDTTNLVSCTRIGTMDDDDLVGTQQKDKICGLDGDDDIKGRGGNDLLRGSDGHDTIVGATGDDVLFGGYGGDELYGSAGNDKLTGNQNSDYLSGGPGSDDCDGGSGKNKTVSC